MYRNVRVINPCWGEILRGRVDFTLSVQYVAPYVANLKIAPPSNLNTGACAARFLSIN